MSHCLSEILELCNSFSGLLHQRDDLTLSADDRGTVDRIAKVRAVNVLLYILFVLHIGQNER